MAQQIDENRVAKTIPSQMPNIAQEQSVTILLPFGHVERFIESYPAPRRPNRQRPLDPVDDLDAELDAWDCASEEDLADFETRLSE